MIKKRGKKWALVHCHGPDAGKTIATFTTRGKAQAMHRAIAASKARRKRR